MELVRPLDKRMGGHGRGAGERGYTVVTCVSREKTTGRVRWDDAVVGGRREGIGGEEVKSGIVAVAACEQ